MPPLLRTVYIENLLRQSCFLPHFFSIFSQQELRKKKFEIRSEDEKK